MSALLHAAALLALPSHAFQKDQAEQPYKGLPSGEQLDWGKVLDSRYGAERAPAPVQDPAAGRQPPAQETAPPGRKSATPEADSATSAATPAATPPAAPPAGPARIAGALATVWVERSGAAGEEERIPVTFGQVFAPGAVERGVRLEGRLADGAAVPLQVDAKARHRDGSLRHAVVSALLPAPQARQLALGLVKAKPDSKAAAADDKATPAALLRAGLDATVRATVEGKAYTASLEQLLKRGQAEAWLDGPVAREWHVAAPLAGPDGKAHPHLAARFAVRWYPGVRKARVDVTVENNWAFEPDPQNFTYDAEITVGGEKVVSKAALEHYHHARWRTLAWWGGAAPAVHLRHDTRQLIDSFALPNYDRSVQVDERALAKLVEQWRGPSSEPMGVGLAMRAMGTTGGRPDIGLQPGWAAMYLLGMDPRAKMLTLGTADLAGSWSMHYRDRRTGLPVSLLDYPNMTTVGSASDARNRETGKSEMFPPCASKEACRTPNKHDISHQPNFAYLPYLVTGDHYYLEELQFWAMYDVFASNPGYRERRKGLLKPEQVRGQAWGLRTLAEAAYITPDGHPLKSHFLEILDSNLEWYNAEYPRNPAANKLGIIANGYAIGYRKKTAAAPWMDDFFTSAVGRAAELGFDKARPLLKWKAKFPVARMIGEGSCWVTGAMYALVVRDSPTAPFYDTIAQVFQASHEPEVRPLPCASAEMAAALKLRPGEMSGYSSSVAGFPSNMQPALAYAADALGEEGRKAWQQFMARSVKPNYGTGPQFAIVPR
ncbi:hypothetical protein [Massilia niastensis]|uniref:hypothetical protein n=1 Tax=Massilia niastensis TaxID=544911 RepID=UPI0003700437|nr:hypothetical protein [Massilia niastensis]